MGLQLDNSLLNDHSSHTQTTETISHETVSFLKKLSLSCEMYRAHRKNDEKNELFLADGKIENETG